MRNVLQTVVLFAFIGMLASCSSSRKASRDFVPFTKELKERLERDNIDIKQVQFYVDQKLILSRYLTDEKAQVTLGKVRLENGKYINEVIINPYTPGVCEEIENGNLMISFEKGSSNLGFGLGSNYTAHQYVLYGYDWRNGTAVVNFDNNKFRARCGTCTDVAMARLMIKKNVIDKSDKKTRVLEGRKVE
ncbi:MAG: hypothetical protein JST58_04345 [Bacteroidetes bacterium]|nr:hypothetical protein [Bacteroidota bacterium]